VGQRAGWRGRGAANHGPGSAQRPPTRQVPGFASCSPSARRRPPPWATVTTARCGWHRRNARCGARTLIELRPDEACQPRKVGATPENSSPPVPRPPTEASGASRLMRAPATAHPRAPLRRARPPSRRPRGRRDRDWPLWQSMQSARTALLLPRSPWVAGLLSARNILPCLSELWLRRGQVQRQGRGGGSEVGIAWDDRWPRSLTTTSTALEPARSGRAAQAGRAETADAGAMLTVCAPSSGSKCREALVRQRCSRPGQHESAEPDAEPCREIVRVPPHRARCCCNPC